MLLLMKFVCICSERKKKICEDLFCIDERDINTDFVLVLLRDMLNTYPQLKVILMSGK